MEALGSQWKSWRANDQVSSTQRGQKQKIVLEVLQVYILVVVNPHKYYSSLNSPQRQLLGCSQLCSGFWI